MAVIQQGGYGGGRAYITQRKAEGKTHKEALRALKRRLSNTVYARMVADARRQVREGNQGRLLTPARPARPRMPVLRTSHNPDPLPTSLANYKLPLDAKGEPLQCVRDGCVARQPICGRGVDDPTVVTGQRGRCGADEFDIEIGETIDTLVACPRPGLDHRLDAVVGRRERDDTVKYFRSRLHAQLLSRTLDATPIARTDLASSQMHCTHIGS
ncbi:hypothetical protein [Nocardia terpenica]|uniref:hypothetical protein n=1 Tax=Nocardia terpenica TaxID=455432 RepID=UPI001EEA1B68|nr:hypothetical protein [Nocardia terpenica]